MMTEVRVFCHCIGCGETLEILSNDVEKLKLYISSNVISKGTECPKCGFINREDDPKFTTWIVCY